MASDSEAAFSSISSFIETLINSRNRDSSLFLPFTSLNATNPSQETQNQETPRDRIILINPFTQTTLVIEADSLSSLGFGSLFDGKNGRRPASKASIDAMESVEIENDDENCVICLEDWSTGEKVKEMPCHHRFCGGCIEKWLRAHGSCPICRYEMPVEEDEDGDGKIGNEEGGERRRRLWVGLAVGIERNESEF